MQVINFKLTYDKTFTLKSTASSFYTAGDPATTEDNGAMTSAFVLTQKVDDEKVTGDSVLVATFTFQVAGNAVKKDAQGTPFSVEIVGISSGAGLKVVAYKPGYIYDYQGKMSATSGHVKVAVPTEVGIVAYVSNEEQELVNLPALGLPTPTSVVSVRALSLIHI